MATDWLDEPQSEAIVEEVLQSMNHSLKPQLIPFLNQSLPWNPWSRSKWPLI